MPRLLASPNSGSSLARALFEAVNSPSRSREARSCCSTKESNERRIVSACTPVPIWPGDPFSGLFSPNVIACRENPGVLTFAMLCPVTEIACWAVNKADLPISTSLLIDIRSSTNPKKTNPSFEFLVSGF